MNRSLLLACFAFAIAFCALSSPAYAQATRTWVSGVGDDANPCSRTAPCKTWAGSISKTAPGGEIDALDPGGFGGLTITKAITIDGGGGQVASTLVSGTNGFVIAAGANDVVILRNLRINGIGTGLAGVSITTAGQVNIVNCDIFGFTGAGINLIPTARTLLNVANSTIENNNGGGVVATPSGSGSARVTIDSTNILDNTTGSTGTGVGVAATNARVSISNSLISENQDGIFSSGASILIFQTRIVNNFGNGVHASNSGVVALALSNVSENHLLGVLSDTSGTISSFGTNYLYGNGGGNGTLTPPVLAPMMLRRNPPL